MIWFAVDAPRTTLLEDYIEVEPALRDRLRQVTYPELFRNRRMAPGTWVFTSLDALSPAELQMVARMQDAAREAGMPVLNHAHRALRRYELLEALHGAGINDFRAFRATAPIDSARFPVFVREADEHHGSLTPLLHDRNQLRRSIAYLRLRGFLRGELLVVEFCETGDPDGLYRKYSIFRIGDAFVPRFLHAGSYWMTKHGTRAGDEELIREDLAYVRDNPHAAWARRVFETARIEYGRLDYGVRKGRPQAWEINLTPVIVGNPGRGPDTVFRQELRRLTMPAKQIALAGLRAAFLSIDREASGGSGIQLDFPPDLERAAAAERSAIEARQRRRKQIDVLAAAPALRTVGSVLRRVICGDSS